MPAKKQVDVPMQKYFEGCNKPMDGVDLFY